VEIREVLCGFMGYCSKNAAFFLHFQIRKQMRSEKLPMTPVISGKMRDFPSWCVWTILNILALKFEFVCSVFFA
jgi:hypothetical protein